MSAAATGNSVTIMLACMSARSKPGYCCAIAKPAGGARVTLVPGMRTLCPNDGWVNRLTKAASVRERMRVLGTS